MIDIALKGRAAILGLDHPDTFLGITWEGEILCAEQRSQQLHPADCSTKLNIVDSLHLDALKNLTIIFGSEHRDTLQCKVNLAAAKLERETRLIMRLPRIFTTMCFFCELSEFGGAASRDVEEQDKFSSSDEVG